MTFSPIFGILISSQLDDLPISTVPMLFSKYYLHLFSCFLLNFSFCIQLACMSFAAPDTRMTRGSYGVLDLHHT